jgi:Reverse transcriptase (RNA-dependent DNA polymerase)
MDEDARRKSAFTTHAGTYEFNRLPFRLSNAPAAFQRTMDVILPGLLWMLALVYVDDIIVFSNSFESHISDVNHVLHLLSEAGVVLKLSKCCFFVPELNYLGYVVVHGVTRMQGRHICAISDLK